MYSQFSIKSANASSRKSWQFYQHLEALAGPRIMTNERSVNSSLTFEKL